MISKPLVLSMYETSILSRWGVPLAECWDGIVAYSTEPDIKALYSGLSKEFKSGSPSFGPFEQNPAMKDDVVVASHFAEIGMNTSLYEQSWSDMAVAYLLKQKLAAGEPSDADGRLAAYLLSQGDDMASGHSLREEMHGWSHADAWKLPETQGGYMEFPQEWWASFEINAARIEFPRTIPLLLKNSLESGTLDTAIPEAAQLWTRFVQVADSVFA